jgi:hypothetical protein
MWKDLCDGIATIIYAENDYSCAAVSGVRAANLGSVKHTKPLAFFGFPGIYLGTRETIFLFLLSESKYLSNYTMSHSRTQQH